MARKETKNKKPKDDFHSKVLREKAEKILKSKLDNKEDIDPKQIKSLLHELQVHQIELEIQNENLRETHAELENTIEQYMDLYDNAPAGYATSDTFGVIIKANQTLANMFGTTVSKLLNSNLAPWCIEDDAFYKHCRNMVNKGGTLRSELLFRNKHGSNIFVSVESKLIQDNNSEDNQRIRSVFLDISDRIEIEKLLKESEQKAKAISHNALDGIITINHEGNITYFNPAAQDIFGYKSSEVVGKPIHDFLLSKESSQAYKKELVQFRETGKCKILNKKLEFNATKKDGTRFPVEIMVAAFKHKGQWHSVGTIRDITERRQAEETRLARIHALDYMDQINRIIQETADLKQMMSNILQKILLFFQCDRAGLLFPCDPDAPSLRITVEHTTPQYLGALTIGEDIAMTPEAAKVLRMVLDVEGPIVYDPISGLALDNVARSFSVQSQILMALYPKVGKPWLLVAHQCTYPRIWTEEDQRLFQDIGHRLADALSSLLFLKDLQESEERFRTLVQKTGDVIIVLAPDFKILEFNNEAEKVYGVKRDMVLGKNYLDLFAPEEEVKRLITIDLEKVLSGYPTKAFENKVRSLDGSECVFSWNVNRLLNYEDYPVVAIACGHDITERKRVEENLKDKKKEIEDLNVNLEKRVQEEVEKSRQKDLLMMHQSRLAAMGEMIGNIAHQWKQPLNALNILLYNIKEYFDSDEKEPELVNNFIEKGNELVMKMATTIDDFRYFFKPNKKKENFSVNKIINDSLALVSASFRHNNISVISNLKEEMVVVGFPNEYSQVILNILNNAKDAIIAKGKKGEVKIQTYREDGNAVVKIKDNAGGIPNNILNNIFDPYFTTKKEGKGTGIGLYMSKMIIEEHMNGRIKVMNKDDGAEFMIITPGVLEKCTKHIQAAHNR